MVAPRNKSKSTTAPGQRTNQPTSPAARPKHQQSPREVRRRVFPSDIDPSPSCPTPSMPSNRPQPAAGHVTPWTSCYAPPPPTRVIVPASAEHQAAHNATRSRDPRATIGHNKNARRGGEPSSTSKGGGECATCKGGGHDSPPTTHQQQIQQQTRNPTTNQPSNDNEQKLVTRGLPSIHSPPTPTRVTVPSPR